MRELLRLKRDVRGRSRSARSGRPEKTAIACNRYCGRQYRQGARRSGKSLRFRKERAYSCAGSCNAVQERFVYKELLVGKEFARTARGYLFRSCRDGKEVLDGKVYGYYEDNVLSRRGVQIQRAAPHTV